MPVLMDLTKLVDRRNSELLEDGNAVIVLNGLVDDTRVYPSELNDHEDKGRCDPWQDASRRRSHGGFRRLEDGYSASPSTIVDETRRRSNEQ